MSLTLFKDALPMPKILNPKERNKNSTYYEVKMKEFYHQFHSELAPTKVWGYEAQIPGPTIVVNEGECTKVKWMNNLPSTHFLPLDRTLHGTGHGMPEVRTVVHLHGSEVEPNSDGHPEAWFTNDFKQCGPRFENKIYTYTNKQRPTALWYHDHAIGITRLNVYAGLAGMYIIRNAQEKALHLPSGKYEIPLVIQDKSFDPESQLDYPSTVTVPNPPPDFPDVSITPGVAGDTIIVNGKAWPYLNVEQRKYRFRMLNASNERFYKMKLDSNQPFIQIGSDGGLLQKPVSLKEITIAPSERVDLIIDFTNQPIGTRIVLKNSAKTPFDFGADPVVGATDTIMQFRVVKCMKPDKSVIPKNLSVIKRYNKKDVKVTRDITIDVRRDEFNRLLFLLNKHEFMDCITEEPIIGQLENWRIINSGLGYHPIHIHQIQFQIASRRPFDTALYNLTGEIKYTGDPQLPPPNERGWKDTVQATPGFITSLLIRFGPFEGRYVYHCHILEHEDHDMMRQFNVRSSKCTDKCNPLCVLNPK